MTPVSRRIRLVLSSDCSLAPIKTASLSKIGSPIIARPACLRVVPVDTTSAIASATPNFIELSTAPSSETISEFILKRFKAWVRIPGYDVAIRLPCRALSVVEFARPAGSAKRKVDFP